MRAINDMTDNPSTPPTRRRATARAGTRPSRSPRPAARRRDGERALALLGDLPTGHRVIELGVNAKSSIGVAIAGAKAIAVDPDARRLTQLRTAAAAAEVAVECHDGDLADLGFAPSGTIDAVVSIHTLDLVDDLDRILRQVHRVLRPGAPFVLTLDHPFASVSLGAGDDGEVRRYGDERRTMGELLAALDRNNFRLEIINEPGVDARSPVPTTLELKVRKLGS